VFLAGLCTAGVLVGLVIDQRLGKSSLLRPQTRIETGGATGTPSLSAATSTGSAATPAPSTAGQPVSVPALRLVVNASRGDSWIMVRSGSKTGKLLFQGILVKGRSLRVAGSVLWVRVGAGAHLDARVNGRLLTLQAGTFNALLTPSG
jgi:Domain of unknown function (DUF4115)